MRLGSDPERFLVNAEGKVISAIGLIGGSKTQPLPVPSLGKGFSIQEDNVLAEYNTPPAKSRNDFIAYQKAIQDYLSEKVEKQGLKLSNIASAIMTEDQMNHPKAWVFGCDPDFNVWSLEMNPKPKAPDPLLRSSGGHIHVECDDDNSLKVRLGRALDVFVGAPLCKVDPDVMRRQLYGQAGSIRFKPYGIEYRTPSNFWTLCEENIRQVWERVSVALTMASNIQSYKQIPKEIFTSAVKAINDNDVQAREYVDDWAANPFVKG